MSHRQIFNDIKTTNLTVGSTLTVPRTYLNPLEPIISVGQLVYDLDTNSLFYSTPGSWSLITSGIISSSCGESLISETGPIIKLKGLVAGTGILIDASTDCITITSDTETYLYSASGISLVYKETGPDLTLKGIYPGPGISIVDNGSYITLLSSSAASAISLSSVAGTSLVSNGAGPNMTIKGLTAGTGIILQDVGGSIAIINVSQGTPVSLSSVAGTSLVSNGAGPNMTIKGLTAGTGIILQDVGGSIAIINVSQGPPVSLSSVAGTSLVSNGAGPNMTIKGLTAGTGIILQDVGGSISIIGSSISNISLDNFNSNTGITLIPGAPQNGSNLTLNKLQAGTGIGFNTNITGIINIYSLSPSIVSLNTTNTSFNTLTSINTTTNRSKTLDMTIMGRVVSNNIINSYIVQTVYINNSGVLTKIGIDQMTAFKQSNYIDIQTISSGTNILVQVKGDGSSINWIGYIKDYESN